MKHLKRVSTFENGRITNNDHLTTGLMLIEKDGQLILANITKSTPAACIDKWRSRCGGATLLEVEGRPVHTIKEVEEIIKNAKNKEFDQCRIILAHPEIKTGITSQGIPQLQHIDQLNTRFILNLENLAGQEAPIVYSGGVRHYAFN